MKKWLILAWLLIPVALVSYHFGPGQAAFAYRQAQTHLADAQKLEQDGHFDEAIDRYGETLAALPESDEPPPDLALRRDQLRLAQIRSRFQLGRLAETLDSLNVLIEDIERDHGANSALAEDARDLLGRVHYQAMVALRLKSAEEAVWKKHWELARQNFRFLAEHTTGRRNSLDRRNLEVVIKSFNLPQDAFAAPAGGATTTAGLATTKPPPPNAAANGGGPPTKADARPRPEAPPNKRPPPPDEFDLGS
ncbi:MAG: hypothetical protein DWI21_06900 [Planctomycetota bacterium]|nr:MAG: hypothetical protein DWI21_06900 [Planctomycetota bacterium]